MKICLAVGMQKDIPMRVVQTKNSPLAEYTDFRAHMSTDTEYLGQLDAHLEK